MNEEILRTALILFKEGEVKVDNISELGLREDVIQSLIRMGWVEKVNNTYRFVLDVDTFTDRLIKSSDKVDVPFRSGVYGRNTFVYIRIPSFIVRTFDIQKGDLLVIRHGNCRISGTISSNKNLFYIHKCYWDCLGIPEEGLKSKIDEQYEFVLEGVYKKRS